MDSANAASAASPRSPGSLTRRVISAAVTLPFVALAVYWGGWIAVLAIAGVVVLTLHEFYQALTQHGLAPRRLTGIIFGTLLAVTPFIRLMTGIDITVGLFTLGLIIALTIELRRGVTPGSLNELAITLLGAWYVGLCMSFVLFIRQMDGQTNPSWLGQIIPGGMPLGAAWLYMVLAITWLQDTAAYFAGRAFGKHHMAPTLSPKKTWEGAIGGLLMAIASAMICIPLIGIPLSYGGAALLGAIGGIVGPIGDLAESWIKRQYGLKDMGNIMPGHGGLMDRLDSLLFTAPILAYGILVLMMK